jgi:hypothetical protein
MIDLRIEMLDLGFITPFAYMLHIANPKSQISHFKSACQFTFCKLRITLCVLCPPLTGKLHVSNRNSQISILKVPADLERIPEVWHITR